MRKNKLLLLLVLLMTVATGAWADTTVTWTASDLEETDLFINFEAGSAAHNTIKGITVTASSGGNGAWQGNNISMDEGSTTITFTSSVGNIKSIAITAQSIYTYGSTPSGWTLSDYSKLSWSGDASPTVSMTLSDWTEISHISEIVFTIESAPATTYSVTLAEGTEDAENWSVPAEAPAGSPVTATYSGDKKVKSVKAVKKASGPGVTTFSELQTALSAGKDVKLMNDIECTAEIEITSGPLTIDGNGKTLSTTSAIRAFKVKSSATVAFKNLTLTGFVSGGSPAINNNGGTIVLDGCTISNCHVSGGQGGGAIENKGGGKLYAINTTFSGNYSGEIGGAINNYGGSLYMSDCTFTNNYTTSNNAFYGGAIGINGGSEIRLINCTFSGNKYGTNTGNNDIGVYSKPTNDNYTIAGCTGATIASAAGDITTNATGTATLDYSDLSNISFTYTPVITTLNNTIKAWTAGSYAVPAGGLTYSDAITVSGDVTLTLTDGETLTLNKGISLAEGATLTIQGNGTMNINGTNNSTASTVAGTGMLVLTSGTLNAKGGNGDGLIITDSWLDTENNIGVSGGVAINGNVTVNGGTVTATGGNGGNLNTSQIVGGYNNHGGNGGAAISGNVTVNAGGWTATNGSNGTYTPGSDDNGCSAGTGGKAVAGTVTDNR